MAAGPSLLVVETGLSLAVFLIALCWPHLGSRWFAIAERFLGKFAKKKALAIITVTLLVIVLRLAMLPLIPIPQPYIHDEFSYLLAADTFASGRLTNPTHPMWQHFESFHIEFQPTYMSMYFPGQGIVMAAGKVLCGHPWYGVLASAAVMCGAICWMLQGWLPPGWALFGAMLAVVRLGLFSYWVNSYYGGAVAAIGGALVLGALPRLAHRPLCATNNALRSARIRDGLLMSLGMVILANSRAWEGALVCGPVVLILIWTFFRRKRLRLFARQMILPLALLALGGVLTGYYNFKVFGSPFTLAYQVNRATYAMAPVFLWLKPRPEPHYRYPEMRDFYVNWELRGFNRFRTATGFLANSANKTAIFLCFFVWAALLPPLLTARRVLRDRRVRPLLWIGFPFITGLYLSAWFSPHYAAPFAGAIYVMLVQGYRHLRQWRPHTRPVGLMLTRATPALCLGLAALRVWAVPLDLRIDRYAAMWYGTAPLGLARAAAEEKLSRNRGGQLAIVKYSSNHSFENEWVYNAADLDASKIVWAREGDPRSIERLLHYFANRRVWLVEPDKNPPTISPYRAAHE